MIDHTTTFDYLPRSLRGLKVLLIVYLGALLFSAIVSPYVYDAIGAWYVNSPNELNEYLLGKWFPDYFDRFRWVFVLLGLPFIFKACQLSPATHPNNFATGLQTLGFTKSNYPKKSFFKAFYFGACMLSLVVIFQMLNAEVTLRGSIHSKIWNILLTSLLGAILIGVLEEMLFRGVIRRIFEAALGEPIGIIFASLFFAYAHFKMPDQIWTAGDQSVDLSAGLNVAWWTIAGITVNFKLFYFLNLFLLGCILCLWVKEKKSIWPAVAFHTGLVFVMLTVNKIFKIKAGDNEWWVGTARIADGAFATIPLSIILAYFLIRKILRG